MGFRIVAGSNSAKAVSADATAAGKWKSPSGSKVVFRERVLGEMPNHLDENLVVETLLNVGDGELQLPYERSTSPSRRLLGYHVLKYRGILHSLALSGNESVSAETGLASRLIFGEINDG